MSRIYQKMIEAEKYLISFVVSSRNVHTHNAHKISKLDRNGIVEVENGTQSLQVSLLENSAYLHKPIQPAPVLFPAPFHKGPQYPD